MPGEYFPRRELEEPHCPVVRPHQHPQQESERCGSRLWIAVEEEDVAVKRCSVSRGVTSDWKIVLSQIV